MKPIEKQADRLFSAFIKKRDGGCVEGRRVYDATGGSDCWGELECAHLLGRSLKAVRWDPRNAVALCSRHHGWFTDHPLAWVKWREERVGSATMQALLRRAYGGPKPDVAAIVKELKA